MFTTSALLLSAAIQHSNPHLSHRERDRYASWVLEEAREHSLDPWIFPALINRETHWTATALRHEADGSCSVGLGQINVRCSSPEVVALQQPHANLHRMGAFLSRIRASCTHDCENLGWLRAYNPGDAEYLSAVQAAVRNAHAQDGQPAVRRVRAHLHASRVRGEEAH